MDGFDDGLEGEMEPEDGEAMPAEEEQPDLLAQLAAWADSPNIAAELPEDTLSQIGARVIAEFEIDDTSRADWKHEAKLAMDAILQKAETKNYPFEGASNIKYPVLTNAVLQFGARTYPAIIPGDRVVKAKTIGPDPHGLKQARGERVSMHMSDQLLRQMPNWESDTDTMVHQLPGVGHAFRKVYRDGTGRPRSDLVSAMNVVVNQATRDLDSVPRITHVIDDLYPHQIETRIRAGTFVEFEYGAATPQASTRADGTSVSAGDVDAPHVFLEQHRYEDLDGDGLREPWIITVHKDTGKVVRVVAGYDVELAVVREDGVIVDLPKRGDVGFIGYPFLPDPNGGYYGIGFGRLLRAIGEAVNTTLNQIIDAAHLQNAGGGFIGSGLNVKKASQRVEMNKWTNVTAPGQKIREAIVPHDFRGPSPVLFQVLGLLIEASKGIASVQDVLTGEAKAQTMQPTTLLALIEQGLKVYTSIIKRLFRSLAKEFQLLYAMNRKSVDEQAEKDYAELIDFQPPESVVAQVQQLEQVKQQYQQMASQAQQQGMEPPPPPPDPPPSLLAQLEPPTMAGDYENLKSDIVPVADPSQVTDMQKMAKAQLIMETMEHPNVNKEQALRRVYDAANIEDIDQLIVPTPAGPDPLMIEDMKAGIEDKRAGAMQKMAQAEKITVETHGTMQTIAQEHAQFASGQMDDNAALETETARLQNNKTEREMALKERQQDSAEKQAQAQAKGEAA
jgi:chaperonin GroES